MNRYQRISTQDRESQKERQTWSMLEHLLEKKLQLLNDLVNGQRSFKAFIAQASPQWSQFEGITHPQEKLLGDLKTVNGQQQQVLDQLCHRHLDLPTGATLKMALPHANEEFQTRLTVLSQAIKEACDALKRLSRLSYKLAERQTLYGEALKRFMSDPSGDPQRSGESETAKATGLTYSARGRVSGPLTTGWRGPAASGYGTGGFKPSSQTPVIDGQA